jgi:hypothetical protein
MLTLRVVLTQLLLVVIIWFVSKFGKKPLVGTTILLLLYCLFQVFTPELFVLQITVVMATTGVCYHKIREKEVKEMVTAFRNILDRLTRK